jgi:hypothetical protein
VCNPSTLTPRLVPSTSQNLLVVVVSWVSAAKSGSFTCHFSSLPDRGRHMTKIYPYTIICLGINKAKGKGSITLAFSMF